MSYESRAADARREMRDEDQWETVPAPSDPPGRLSAQVVIRLDAETAARCRELGDLLATPYTALLRGWIEERIRHEWDAHERARHEEHGRIVIRPAEQGGWEVVRADTENDGRIGVYQQIEQAEQVAKAIADAERRAYRVLAA